MISFKEHLLLTEARQKGLTYTEKQAKGAVERVTLTLEGTNSAAWTRVARRYARLESSLAALTEARKELNEKLKGDIAGVFDPADIVLTRVVETAQFTITVAKQVKKPGKKVTVDYEAIASALAALIPDELQEQVDAIVAKYSSEADHPDPPMKLSVSKDLKEAMGLLDRLKKWAASYLGRVQKWATRYDTKLDAIKRKANMIKEDAEIKGAFDEYF